MLKKTMTYKDYDDNERTEDFYFNLNKVEITEMEVAYEGGFVKTVEKIIAAQDAKTLIAIFKELILKAYGEKSLDGKHFVKRSDLSEKFSQTEAYVDLFMELSTNAEAAKDFVNGIASSVIDKK